MTYARAVAASRPGTLRWVQLLVGIICMVMIANLQYGWTLFVSPIDEKYHWGRAAIKVAFTIFVLTETWLVPVEGWLVDRFGPKIVVFVVGVLVAIAWMMNSAADTLTTLYIAAALGGISAGQPRRPDSPGPDFLAFARLFTERTDAPLLRLGFRPNRSGKHDVHCLWFGSCRYFGSERLRP